MAIAIVALILEAGARCELNVYLVSSAGRLVIFGFLLGGWRYIIINNGLSLMGLNNYMGARFLSHRDVLLLRWTFLTFQKKRMGLLKTGCSRCLLCSTTRGAVPDEPVPILIKNERMFQVSCTPVTTLCMAILWLKLSKPTFGSNRPLRQKAFLGAVVDYL